MLPEMFCAPLPSVFAFNPFPAFNSFVLYVVGFALGLGGSLFFFVVFE
jgi:hypothetical protein